MVMKLTQMGIALDTAQIEKAHRLMDSLQKKMYKYNEQVREANKLLSQYSKLKKEAGLTIEKGEVKGLQKPKDK